MKKLLAKIFTGLFFLTAIVSCSNDDGPDVVGHLSIEESLMGKWFITETSYDNGAFIAYDHQCDGSRDYQEFMANGTLNFVSHNANCEVTDVSASQWELDGRELTITGGIPNSNVITIESVTSQMLVLKKVSTIGDIMMMEEIHYSKI